VLIAMRKDESKCAYQTMSLFGEEPKPAPPKAKPAPSAPPAQPPAKAVAEPPVKAAAPVASTTARRVEIFFDGGCLGNPGKKYGSFQVKLDGKEILKRSRVNFGFGTNNEAEFNALKLGLDEAVAWLQSKDIALKPLALAIETDSTIVRNRLVVKNVIFKKYPSSERMFALASECLAVMRQFGSFQVTWKGRAKNVERFGH
jgi:ribonuclease HI